MAQVAKKYKDNLFRALFGSPERKHLALALYNALNDTNYRNPEDIEIFTLDDVVFLGMRNDVAFVLAGDLTLIEHQSTMTPNMPLRAFLYAAHEIEKYLQKAELGDKVYYSKRIIIPTPKLIVLYNGTKEEADTIVHLSESFEHPDQGDIEATVHIYNINAGRNLPNKCVPLNDYATFVAKYRSVVKELGPIEAVNQAINTVSDGEVKSFLLAQKSGVIDMLLTEYNEEKVREGFAEAAKEEGIKQEQKRVAQQLLASGKLSKDEILTILGISISD